MSTAQLERSLNQQISVAFNAARSALHEPSLRSISRARQVEFLDPYDEAFARALDEYGIEWRYKPRTFAVEWDDEGNFVDSFTPDFYLPANDLYIELVSTNCESAAADARSVRLLRQNNPSVHIDLIDAASLTCDSSTLQTTLTGLE